MVRINLNEDFGGKYFPSIIQDGQIFHVKIKEFYFYFNYLNVK